MGVTAPRRERLAAQGAHDRSQDELVGHHDDSLPRPGLRDALERRKCATLHLPHRLSTR